MAARPGAAIKRLGGDEATPRGAFVARNFILDQGVWPAYAERLGDPRLLARCLAAPGQARLAGLRAPE